MKFYIVDAFSDEIFGGNPAGVVILEEGQEFPSDKICIKTAKELRYSETSFIKRLNDREFNIRYFTPAAEVELCGHATIGSFAALRNGGYIGDGQYINHTVSGKLNVEVSGENILMDMAPPVKINEISEEEKLAELYDVMGLSYSRQKERGMSFIPQMISTGLPDIMMPVASLKDLDNIEPDFKALSGLSEAYQVVGVHAFTLEGDDATCHVRNFAPLYDIDEEAATGTSNGALTYYGYLNGFIKSGDDCKFIQGEKMNRPSAILTNIKVQGDKCIIRAGGRGIIVAEGNINI